MKRHDRAVQAILSDLPTSEEFTTEEWTQRHNAVTALYAGLIVVVAVVTGLVQRGYVDGEVTDGWHVALELVGIGVPMVVLRLGWSRLVAQLVVTFGLLSACGLLVHVTGGLIESHFSFFIVLPLVALYTDWRPFGFAVVYVALGHGVLGAIDPARVYNHEAAVASPYLWGLIHASYILCLSVVMLVHWHFTDRKRSEMKATLTDLQLAQEQLVQAQKLESIGRLAAGVAHEINTPVQFVSDNTSFVADSIAEAFTALDNMANHLRSAAPALADSIMADADIDYLRAEIPLALEQSSEGLRRITEIVRAMKEYSHPGTEIEDNDLNQIIQSTVEVSRNEWKYVADLELDLDPAVPAIRCSAGQLKQVVLNLIVNAAQAIESAKRGVDRGTIRVSSTAVGATVELRVADDGCGMAPDVRERIFDQFFTTKEVGSGTGQGLALAWDAIRGHHGTIDVDSTPGVGTTFTIILPFDPESVTA